MSNIYSMTEDDLIKFRDHLVMKKKSLGAGKRKAIAVLNSIVGLVAVGSGVVITLLFSGPVSVAVLGGLPELTSRRSPRRIIRKIKEKTTQRDKVKNDLIAVEARLKDLQTVRVVQNTLYPSLNLSANLK